MGEAVRIMTAPTLTGALPGQSVGATPSRGRLAMLSVTALASAQERIPAGFEPTRTVPAAMYQRRSPLVTGPAATPVRLSRQVFLVALGSEGAAVPLANGEEADDAQHGHPGEDQRVEHSY
jgi:hypothetical protein